MGTLYDNIHSLCEENGIKGGKMCVDIGASKSLMTDLKAGRKKSISSETAQRIAAYFDVSTDRVLYGDEQKETAPTNTGRDGEDVYAAFFDGENGLTEEEKAKLWQDAKDFVAFKIAQKKGKQ